MGRVLCTKNPPLAGIFALILVEKERTTLLLSRQTYLNFSERTDCANFFGTYYLARTFNLLSEQTCHYLERRVLRCIIQNDLVIASAFRATEKSLPTLARRISYTCV